MKTIILTICRKALSIVIALAAVLCLVAVFLIMKKVWQPAHAKSLTGLLMAAHILGLMISSKVWKPSLSITDLVYQGFNLARTIGVLLLAASVLWKSHPFFTAAALGTLIAGMIGSALVGAFRNISLKV
jgi:hypothetical protein